MEFHRWDNLNDVDDDDVDGKTTKWWCTKQQFYVGRWFVPSFSRSFRSFLHHFRYTFFTRAKCYSVERLEHRIAFESTRHVYLPICNRNIVRFKWIKIDWRVMDEMGGREKRTKKKNAKVWSQFRFWWRKLTHKTRSSGRICFVNCVDCFKAPCQKKRRTCTTEQQCELVSWLIYWLMA